MFPFAFYLFKVMLCSGILFGYYWFILRNKIFHHYNRFYLLASVVLSLTLPIIQINIWHNANVQTPQAIKILQAVTSNDYLDEIVVTARKNNFTTDQALFVFYCITSIIFFCLFIGMLVRIRALFVKHRHSIVQGICFVNTVAEGTPFSFLKYIFWNDHIDPNTITGRQIFKHELAHVQQKHSYDKLFLHAVLIFSWCNPFFWLIRKELIMIHEFMADKIAVEDSDTEAFAAMILQATYPRHHFQLINPFFYSPIKRRLIMLSKNENTKAGYISRVLALPLVLFIFAAFTLKTKTFKINPASFYNGKKITVVIDAGHGGDDKGAQSPSGNIAEKDLTLEIIKKIKALNQNASINIVLTRETDVNQSPREKAAFTKKQNADLFVSVHTGATTIDANTKTGMSVWVSKDNYANSNSSKLFATLVINEFTGNYELPVLPVPQQRQEGILVLQESPCPSVLIEAGSITNKKDLEFLQTNAAKEIIAGNILAAIEKFAGKKVKGEVVTSTPASSSTGYTAGKKTDTIPEIILENNEKPLVLIDGKICSQKELKTIQPENIESVSVLRGKEGINQYGEKGKNGVVIVITREKEILLKDVPVIINQDKSIQKEVPGGNLKIENKINPAAQPLYVIDGKVQEIGSDINSIISPTEIERINVLRDTMAIGKYGEKAKNGVIEITTKNGESLRNIPFSESQEINRKNEGTAVRYNGDQEWLSASTENNPGELHPTKRPGLKFKQEGLQQDKIFTKVEFEPEFPGGDSAWKNYLEKNVKADIPIREGWKPGVYKIVLTFIVKSNGTITDIKSDNYAGSKTAEHCVDLIKKGSKMEACYSKRAGDKLL